MPPRCRCTNIRLYPPEAGGGPAPSTPPSASTSEGRLTAEPSSTRVISGWRVKMTLPSLVKTSSSGLVRCLICKTSVFRELEDHKLELLVDDTALDTPSADPHDPSPLFRLSQTSLEEAIASATVSFPDLTSPPSPKPSASSSSASTILPALPEPFFAPPPFSPAHEAFFPLASRTEGELRAARERLVKEVDAFLETKRRELNELEEAARKEVGTVWRAFLSQGGEAEYASTSEGAGEGEDARKAKVAETPIVEGRSTPVRIDSFPEGLNETSPTSGSRLFASLHASSSSDAPRGTSPSSSPPPPPMMATMGSSLLSASLARGSHMPQPPRRSPDSPKRVSSTSPTRPPLSAVAQSDDSSSNGVSFSVGGRVPQREDLDVATSLVAAPWPEHPRLIYGTHKSHDTAGLASYTRAKELEKKRPAAKVTRITEGVVEEDEGEEKDDKKLKAEPEREKAKTVKEEDGPLKSALAEAKTSEKGVAAAATGGERDGAASKKSSRRRSKVMFVEEPDVLGSEESSEEESIADAESVFEFEEDSVLNGSTPPADPVEIGQTHDGAAAEIPGPSYTLNGQSVHPVQPLSANLPVRPKREPLKEFELDRVEYFNRQLAAAHLPSHRSAWSSKDKNTRTWDIYGRTPNSHTSFLMTEDPNQGNNPFGASLPIQIHTSPSSPRRDASPVVLERKTSFTDVPELMVPALVTATRRTRGDAFPSGVLKGSPSAVAAAASASVPGPLAAAAAASPQAKLGTPTRPGMSQRRSSQVRDPGPFLDAESDDDADEDDVAAVAGGTLVDGRETVGWASLVN